MIPTMNAINMKIKVLVVEDTPVNQQVAQLMLSRLGCEVDISDNGRVALDAIEHKDYDLIFMDCQMPVMDGYETTRELRNREGSRKRSTVVAMTAHALSGDKEKCFAAGMDDYLSKPVKQKDLISILEKWSNKQSEEEEKQKVFQQTSGVTTSFALEIFERLDDLSLVLDAEDLCSIIDLFTTEAPVQFKDLKDAMAAVDYQQARNMAHSLKGSVANLGSARLAELLADIEEQAKGNRLENIEVAQAKLNEHWEEIIKVLLAYKDKLSGV